MQKYRYNHQIVFVCIGLPMLLKSRNSFLTCNNLTSNRSLFAKLVLLPVAIGIIEGYLSNLQTLNP